MKNEKMQEKAESKPQKVLLHMARKNGEWAGMATNFKTEKNYKFRSLKELFNWLNNDKS